MLSLILTVAPEMKVQYFTEEEMEAQRGPQSDSWNRGRAPWLPVFKGQHFPQHGSPQRPLYLSFICHFYSFCQSLNPHQLSSALCDSLVAGVVDFCLPTLIQI